jgi:UPF0716 family protein affecting phage T7 exclusion
MRVRADMNAGRAPTGALAETAMLGVGAGLMILPGLITSAVGCCSFVPPCSGNASARVGRRVESGPGGRPVPAGHAQLELGEGDYRISPRRDTPWQPPGTGPSR